MHFYEALVAYFEDQSNEDVTADEITRRLKEYWFVESLHFLCDFLSTLCQVNKYLHTTFVMHTEKLLRLLKL